MSLPAQIPLIASENLSDPLNPRDGKSMAASRKDNSNLQKLTSLFLNLFCPKIRLYFRGSKYIFLTDSRLNQIKLKSKNKNLQLFSQEAEACKNFKRKEKKRKKRTKLN
jgi:hypothetical protein